MKSTWLRHALALGLVSTFHPADGQELPAKGPAEAFDFEPQVNLLQEIPEVGEVAASTEAEAAGAVDRAKTRLERARTKKVRWEKLARQGVLSRAEAERCAVEVSEALVRYERARVAQQERALDTLRQRIVGGTAEASLAEAAEASLKSARDLATAAEAQLHRTRLANATVTLDRHRRLYAEKLVTRAQLQRAEEALARLQAGDLRSR